MKTGKNISTLFQEGGQNLRVQPSPQAWQRLERRLDRHKRPDGKVVLLHWASAIAAMLVLVAGMYFWSDFMKPEHLAMQGEAVPHSLEVLENTQGCKPYCLVLQARKELPAYYANPVEKLN